MSREALANLSALFPLLEKGVERTDSPRLGIYDGQIRVGNWDAKPFLADLETVLKDYEAALAIVERAKTLRDNSRAGAHMDPTDGLIVKIARAMDLVLEPDDEKRATMPGCAWLKGVAP